MLTCSIRELEAEHENLYLDDLEGTQTVGGGGGLA
jgi:hypothetical protein